MGRFKLRTWYTLYIPDEELNLKNIIIYDDGTIDPARIGILNSTTTVSNNTTISGLNGTTNNTLSN